VIASALIGPVLLELRIMRPDGTISVQEESQTITSAFTVFTKNVRLTEGWLLTASVSSGSVSALRGNCYTAVRILRGFPPAGTFAYTLTQGYVTPNSAVSWPGSIMEPPVAGQGMLRGQSVTNPAAGADWSLTVPANVRWSVLSIEATLVTDATAGNRQAFLEIVASGVGLMRITPQTNQAPSQTKTYNWIPGISPATSLGTDNLMSLGVPTKVLQNYVIRTNTLVKAAGDQWSSITLELEEWLDF
jgi:hypothetical protein